MKIKGFRASAVKAGIKYQDRLDLGLIVSDAPALVSGVFTENEIKAAPVIAGIKRLKSGSPHVRALVVNSGNANACTGKQGLMHVEEVCAIVSRAMAFKPDEVLMSSTGVIGQPLPMDIIREAIPSLVEGLDEEGIIHVAQAILTTDLVKKIALKEVRMGGTPVTLLGIAKGSGMIAPKMAPPHATMLAFILTDASLDPFFSRNILAGVTKKTFNSITVDGSMSTNDTVYMFSNGQAGNYAVNGGKNGDIFEEALHEVMLSLAKQIVQDGEGATKFVNVMVKGARTVEEAEIVARTIAELPLVKTAFFGEDPNWGRIMGAAGQAGFSLIEGVINISIDSVPIVRMGEGLGEKAEADAKICMANKEFTVTVDLGLGKCEASVYTCDLSCDYVKINADYRT